MIWEVTIAYTTKDKKGRDKNVRSNFLIENTKSFGETEKYISKILAEVFADIEVVAIKQSKIKEICNRRKDDDSKIFLATIADYFLNEETGDAKEIKYVVALFAKDIQQAYTEIKFYLSQGLSDMELKLLKESKFTDLI